MSAREPSREVPFNAMSGWTMFFILLAVWIGWGCFFWLAEYPLNPARVVPAILITLIASIVTLCGFFLVNPNMSRVLVLFGRYRGTVRQDGFFWTNPFTMKHELSLKAHNISSQTIKVNDLIGNPIEIGGIFVWQIRDTAQARFDVEDYHEYVDVQIETAVRQLAKTHPYDGDDADTEVTSLRGDNEEVTQELGHALQLRLDRAGIQVLDARISHLAYAPEIASAMLQRQQAGAIIAARKLIVEGAVSMVEDALEQLSRKEVVELDAERKATLVGNLLVVLCGGANAQPIINTGSLYT